MNRNRSKEKLFAISSRQDKEKKYWSEEMQAPWRRSCLPHIASQAPVPDKQFETLPFRIPDKEALQLVSITSGSEPAIQVHALSVIAAVISTYLQQEEILLGVPIYRQTNADLMNTCLPLRIRTGRGRTYKELVLDVRQRLLNALQNQNYPIELLAGEWLSGSAGYQDFPLFDVSVTVENLQPREYVDYLPHNATICLKIENGNLSGHIRYNSNKYKTETVAAFVRHFLAFLQCALAKPGGLIDEFHWLKQEEEMELLEFSRSLDNPLPIAARTAIQFEPLIGIMEERLASIWTEVLEIKDIAVGRQTDFFEVGGQSMSAIRLSTRIHKTFNVRVSLVDLMEARTVQKIAAMIDNRSKGEFSSIPVAPGQPFYQTTHAQQQLFALQEMVPDLTAYNMTQVYELEPSLDIKRITQSLQLLANRHETLRTSFKMINGQVMQEIADQVNIEVETLHDAQVREADIEKVVRNFVKPFDLGRSPLVRVLYLRGANEKHYLAIDMHHIITDAMSQQVLGKDFSALYFNSPLPPMRIQFKDYTEWIGRPGQHPARQQQEAWWSAQFDTAPSPVDLPYDFVRTSAHNFEGSIWSFEMDGDRKKALERLAIRQGTTLNVVLLSIYFTLLSRISGQDDIVVGIPVSGRDHFELEPLVGYFVKTIPIRNKPEAGKKFLSFMDEVKVNVMTGLEYQQYPGKLLWNVVFSYAVPDSAGTRYDTEPRIRRISYTHSYSKFDLTLYCMVGEDQINFSFEYSTQLFREEKIRDLSAWFSQITDQLLENENKSLNEFVIATSLQGAGADNSGDEVEFAF